MVQKIFDLMVIPAISNVNFWSTPNTGSTKVIIIWSRYGRFYFRLVKVQMYSSDFELLFLNYAQISINQHVNSKFLGQHDRLRLMTYIFDYELSKQHDLSSKVPQDVLIFSRAYFITFTVEELLCSKIRATNICFNFF